MPQWPLRISELVADAVHREDQLRALGIGFDLAPKILDVRIDRPLVGLELDSVDGVEQLRAGVDPTGLACQHEEQIELGRRQFDLSVVDGHPALR